MVVMNSCPRVLYKAIQGFLLESLALLLGKHAKHEREHNSRSSSRYQYRTEKP